MSYIEIDFNAARGCSALIKSRAEQLKALLIGADHAGAASAEPLAAFCKTLDALSADLLRETEALAAIDDRMKELHHMTNDGRSLNHGEK